MASLNKVCLIGNLGNDPDVRYAQNGTAVATISVATTEKWKDKDGNPQERTEWHRVKFFGKLAEIVEQYLKKGSQVYVEGSIRSEKYTDKEGAEKISYDIVANEMKMLGGNGRRDDGDGDRSQRPAANSGGARGGQAQRPAARPAAPGGGGGGGSRGANAARGAMNQSNDPFPDDDIPFADDGVTNRVSYDA